MSVTLGCWTLQLVDAEDTDMVVLLGLGTRLRLDMISQSTLMVQAVLLLPPLLMHKLVDPSGKFVVSKKKR